MFAPFEARGCALMPHTWDWFGVCKAKKYEHDPTKTSCVGVRCVGGTRCSAGICVVK